MTVANLNPTPPRKRTIKSKRPGKYNPGPYAGKSLFIEHEGEVRFVVVIKGVPCKGHSRPKDRSYVVAPVLPDGTIGPMFDRLVPINRLILENAVPFGRSERSRT